MLFSLKLEYEKKAHSKNCRDENPKDGFVSMIETFMALRNTSKVRLGLNNEVDNVLNMRRVRENGEHGKRDTDQIF